MPRRSIWLCLLLTIAIYGRSFASADRAELWPFAENYQGTPVSLRGHILVQRNSEFWAIDPQTGRRTKFRLPGYTKEQKLGAEQFVSLGPVIFAPDGRSVLYKVTVPPTNKIIGDNLLLFHLDRGKRTRLELESVVETFGYSPEGRHFYAISGFQEANVYDGGVVYLFDSDLGEKIRSYPGTPAGHVSVASDGSVAWSVGPFIEWNGDITPSFKNAGVFSADAAGNVTATLPLWDGSPRLNAKGDGLYLLGRFGEQATIKELHAGDAGYHSTISPLHFDIKQIKAVGDAFVVELVPAKSVVQFSRFDSESEFYLFRPNSDRPFDLGEDLDPLSGKLLATTEEVVLSPDERRFAYVDDGLHIRDLRSPLGAGKITDRRIALPQGAHLLCWLP